MEDKKHDFQVVFGGGFSFSTLLLLTFIILKLVGVIDWSWVWVLAPLWISAALVSFSVAVGIILAIIIRKAE